MAPTPAASQDRSSGSPGPHPGHLGKGRFALVLLALLWPAQLLTAAGVLTGMGQAQIAEHYHTTQIAWFALVYTLIGTLLTPFAAKAADVFGKQRVLIVITALGLVGDLVTALAPDFRTLLVGRGIAACYAPIAALVYATVREVFPPKQAATASGVISSSFGFVVAACPLLAGWLLDDFGFRGALWCLVACTALALVLLAFVPDSGHRAERTGFDWLGGLLLGGGVTALIYGAQQATAWGWADARTLGVFAGALLVLVAFVLVERVVTHPLLDVRMLSRRAVAGSLGSTSLVLGTYFAVGNLITYLGLYPAIPGVSDGLGWSATHLAWVTLPAGVVLTGTGVAAGLLVRRIDTRFLWWSGGVLAVIGLLLQSAYHHNAGQVIAFGVFTGLGGGLLLACGPVLIIKAVSPDEQGLASGMYVMLYGLVQTLVTQVLFTVLAHHTTVLKGTAFYRDAGYTGAYTAAAVCLAVGLLVSLFIPKVSPVADEQPEDHLAEVTA